MRRIHQTGWQPQQEMWPQNCSFIPCTHPTPALFSSQLFLYSQILSSSSAPCPHQSPSTDSSCHTNLPEHKLQLRGLVGWIHRYLKSQKQEFDHLLALNMLLPSTDSNRKVPPGLSHTQSLPSNTEQFTTTGIPHSQKIYLNSVFV